MPLKRGHSSSDDAGTHTQTRRQELPFIICISVIDLLPTPPSALPSPFLSHSLGAHFICPTQAPTTTLHPSNQNSPAEHINTKPHENISHVLDTKIPARTHRVRRRWERSNAVRRQCEKGARGCAWEREVSPV